MRGWIILLLVIFVGEPVYSQSVFRFIGKGKRLRVERRVDVRNKREAYLARRVLHSSRLRVVRGEEVRSPLRVVGPNVYLKGVGKRFKGQDGWGTINQADGYNGAHHIVTKFVIKQLGGNEECISGAPSVFHPNHNNPDYIDVFHNHSKQMELYKKGGVRAIIDDFFENVPDYSEADQNQIRLEGELWSKYWGLKWE